MILLARLFGIRSLAARNDALRRAQAEIDWAMTGTPFARYVTHVVKAKDALKFLQVLMKDWRD